MSKVRSRFHLTVKEKLRIIEIFEANSGGAKTLSLRKIADLATAELKRNISHVSIKKIINSQADDCADLQIGGVFRYFRYEEAS